LRKETTSRIPQPEKHPWAKMGAEAGSSLLMHVGLLGAGYVLGRVQLLPLAVEFYYELYELSVARKVWKSTSSQFP
jgi:hypothetical protein